MLAHPKEFVMGGRHDLVTRPYFRFGLGDWQYSPWFAKQSCFVEVAAKKKLRILTVVPY